MKLPISPEPEYSADRCADRSTDIVRTVDALPIREEAVVQLGPGILAADMQAVSVNGIGLLRTQVGAKSIGVTVLRQDYIAFALPLSWSGDYRINGEPANASDIYMPGDLDSIHIRGDRRDTLGITIARKPFVQTLAALLGVEPEDIALNQRWLRFNQQSGADLRRQLCRLLDEASAPQAQRAPQKIANDVTGLLLNAFLSAQPETLLSSRCLQRPERIVSLAEECFMAAGSHAVSLADLCAAAKVGKSSLYKAFQGVCGEAPLAYFHRRRLTRARSILINSDAERGAVKHAALEVGLTELGRFSVQYRQLFGESPSATLSKVQR